MSAEPKGKSCDVLDSVERFVAGAADVELLDIETAWLESEEREHHPRRYPRTARVNEVMLEVLADELERMYDPRLEFVTFTGVKVNRDLSYATVFYSTMAATARRRGERAGATRPSRGPPVGDARTSAGVGRQMRIKQVPKLSFEVDPGIASRASASTRSCREIHHDEPRPARLVAGGDEEER